jgi:hypothetical protein
VIDPVDPDHIYVGVSVRDTVISGQAEKGGVVEGRYQAASDDWVWSRVGDDDSGLEGGGIDLVLEPTTGTLYASVYGKGVRRKDSGSSQWNDSSADPSAWENPPGTQAPAQWNVFRLVQSPTSGRIFAALGNPNASSPAPTNERIGRISCEF